MHISALEEVFYQLFLLLLLAAPQTPAYSVYETHSSSRSSSHVHMSSDHMAPYQHVGEDTVEEETDIRITAEIHSHPECSTCKQHISRSSLSEEDLKALYIERTKQLILQKLALTEPPAIDETTVRPLPPEALRILEDERKRQQEHADAQERDTTDQKDFYSKTTDITVISEVVSDCQRGGCFRFSLRSPLDVTKIGSAELWLYNLPDTPTSSMNQTLDVYLLLSGNRTKYLARQTTSSVGWVSVDVSRAVRFLINRFTVGTYILRITCVQCRRNPIISPVAVKADYEPFLIIRTKEDTAKRVKREVQHCAPGACCLHTVPLNFKEINWSSWIIGPSVYNVSFCSGACQAWDPTPETKGINNIMMRLKSEAVANYDLSPCCTVKSHQTLVLIRRNVTGAVLVERLRDMGALSCGCV